jgi:predicted  nucleic acid-binding Zn-ribbon protein
MSDAKTLLELTAADRSLLRLKKQLDELPQRAKLLELRTKRAEVDAKAEQVAQMRRDCEQTISGFQAEEATLKDQVAHVQAQIDQTSNYKEAVALTHEIEGFAKRLERIEFDTLKQLERLDKIAQVEKQVNGALAQLTSQDAELLASYQAQAAAIQKEAAAAQQLREQTMKELSPELLERYERARESKGGLGATTIEGTHCSVCRVELAEGQLAKLRSGPDIGECPYCHRLLVVRT